MMSRATRGDDEVLAAVGFSVDQVPHPVALLSADLIADISAVPKTTLLSASSIDAVRWCVLLEAITRLDVVPGAATWAAMRASMSEGDPSPTPVLRARADDLAADPAFPYFLSGFDHLAVEGMPEALATTCSHIVDGLVPFIDTVLLAGEGNRIVGHESRMTVLLTVLSMALQTLTTADSSHHRQPAAAKALLVGAWEPDVAGSTADPYVGSTTTWQSHEGSLGRAIEATADLVLAGGVPFRVGLKLADVLRDTGLSSATFYRRFGSLLEFEQRLIKRAAPELVRSFRTDLFDGAATSFTGGEVDPDDVIAELQHRAAAKMSRNAQGKRPGSEVLPWMGTTIGTQVFAPAFNQLHDEWGDIFGRIAAELGLPAAETMDRTAVASMLHASSWIGELLTRNAPNQRDAAVFMDKRAANALRLAFGLA